MLLLPAVHSRALSKIWRPFVQLKSTTTKMSTQVGDVLVSTKWLAEQMADKSFKENIRIVDGTWDLPMKKRNFIEEHKQKRICCAKYFNLSDCCDKSSDLPHMLPSPEEFSRYVEDHLQLQNNHHVIIYDNSERFGLFSAPRVWWTFKAFGHAKVSVLDGGLPKWCKDGLATRSGEAQADEKLPAVDVPYKATLNQDLVRDFDFMKENCFSSSPIQVVDARPSGRYRGLEPEPRADIISGHIPRSLSVPFFGCFDMENKVMKSSDDVNRVFSDAGVDLTQPVIVTCGSGVTASVLAMSIFYSQGKLVPLYDGSWFEWFFKAPKSMKISEKQPEAKS